MGFSNELKIDEIPSGYELFSIKPLFLSGICHKKEDFH